jgi:hypothetical protein
MATLTASIEADVPVSFADQEWREFIGRSVYDRFPEGYDDLRSSLADLDADDGEVYFADLGTNRSRVHVELRYDSTADRGSLDRAQRELEGDLGKFREFVSRRCDEVICRH